MIKSMTGFGYREFYYKKNKISISMKSLNSKYCDIYVGLPSSLNKDEATIVELIKKYIKRGKIELNIYIDSNSGNNRDFNMDVNYPALDAYIRAANDIKKRYKLNGALSINEIFKLNIFNLQVKSEKIYYDKKIEQEIVRVIKKVLKMRETEGKNLAKYVNSILGELESHLKFIKKKKPSIVKNYENRLKERIKTLIDKKRYDENRILMEVTILADKIDIGEEIERLNSHILQIKESIKSKISVGRKLEFILQEMLREINTIGSKVSEVDITKRVISMKESIDTLREQIRNIE